MRFTSITKITRCLTRSSRNVFSKIGYFPGFLSHHCNNVLRAISYARMAYSDNDWNNANIISVLTFKLKRVQKCINDGYGMPYKERDQSLRIAIRLGEKIPKHDYHYFMRLHGEKWGELDMEFDGSYLKFSRPEAVTPDQVKAEREQTLIASTKDDLLEQRDIRLFFDIIKKYQHHWWD